MNRGSSGLGTGPAASENTCASNRSIRARRAERERRITLLLTGETGAGRPRSRRACWRSRQDRAHGPRGQRRSGLLPVERRDTPRGRGGRSRSGVPRWPSSPARLPQHSGSRVCFQNGSGQAGERRSRGDPPGRQFTAVAGATTFSNSRGTKRGQSGTETRPISFLPQGEAVGLCCSS